MSNKSQLLIKPSWPLKAILMLMLSFVLVACSKKISSVNQQKAGTTSSKSAPSSLSLNSPATSPGADSTPTITVSGVAADDTVKLFTDSSCTTQVASGVATATSINLTSSALVLGSYTFYANATDTNSNTSACSTANVGYKYISCPANYAFVSGNLSLGVNGFCVMQYEAKNDGSGNAISTEGTTPWVSIKHSVAKTKCTDLNTLNGVTSKYDLISNPEWMTLAYNIEAQNANWSGGTVGSGCLFRGNTGVNDSCGYNGADPEFGTSRNTMASHVLSSGHVVWDVAGNVWEWIDWSLGGSLALGPTTCTESSVEFPNVTCSALAAADYMPENPAGVIPTDYDSTYGLGLFTGGSGGSPHRGGMYTMAYGVGVFTLALNLHEWENTVVGFRCVYRP